MNEEEKKTKEGERVFNNVCILFDAVLIICLSVMYYFCCYFRFCNCAIVQVFDKGDLHICGC